jgi:hypothetical protein
MADETNSIPRITTIRYTQSGFSYTISASTIFPIEIKEPYLDLESVIWYRDIVGIIMPNNMVLRSTISTKNITKSTMIDIETIIVIKKNVKSIKIDLDTIISAENITKSMKLYLNSVLNLNQTAMGET